MQEAFELFDTSGDGKIGAKELHVVMQAIGRDQSVEEVAEMIHKIKVQQAEEKGILPQDRKQEQEEELDHDEFFKLIGDEYARSGK